MHRNVKEMISKILSVVSGHGINIAHMQDKSKGNYAYLILDLDEKPSDEVIESVRAIDGVMKVRVL